MYIVRYFHIFIFLFLSHAPYLDEQGSGSPGNTGLSASYALVSAARRVALSMKDMTVEKITKIF